MLGSDLHPLPGSACFRERSVLIIVQSSWLQLSIPEPRVEGRLLLQLLEEDGDAEGWSPVLTQGPRRPWKKPCDILHDVPGSGQLAWGWGTSSLSAPMSIHVPPSRLGWGRPAQDMAALGGGQWSQLEERLSHQFIFVQMARVFKHSKASDTGI